mgnify:CR=1 FL=1
MSFFSTLRESTAEERDYLFTAPIIADALRGDINRAQYVAFLKEAYFHVKQTVPLLMACGSRLDDDKEWLRGAVAHYIDDEYGHEKWILNDIRACGADADAIRDGEPSPATEFMVSYAWDTIQRRNPAGFFGMVYVLEGTVEITVGDHVNKLAKNESLHFNSGIRHKMRNIGKKEAELLVVIYGP